MPVLKPKQMVWKCRFEDCGFEMSDKSKSTMFNKGFEHHLEKHGLIELNYDWYSKHIQNYFLIE